MPKPPRGPSDPPWEELVTQVTDAVQSLDLDGDELADAIVEGLRDVLETSLGDDLDPLRPPRAQERPRVVVLEGGKNRPEDEDEDETPSPTPNPQIRVIRRTVPVKMSSRTTDPTLHVQPGPTWTLVYQGTDAHAYRLGGQRGHLELELDGAVIGGLSAGQSVDLHGQRIRVRTPDAESATFRFRRLE